MLGCSTSAPRFLLQLKEQAHSLEWRDRVEVDAAQLLGDFLAHRPSAAEGGIRPTYRPGVRLCDLHDALPKKLTDTLEQAMPRLAGLLPGFDAPDALLTAPETRSSSPVRIVRGEDCQSELRGLYPCGEGAGYAGGILSAAVDGMRCAEAVLSRTEDKT